MPRLIPASLTCLLALSAAIASSNAQDPPAAPPAGLPLGSASASSGAAPPPVASTPTGVMVHLRADDPNAVLQLRRPHPGLAGVEGWEPACPLPCGVRLDPALSYRVGGAGLASSYAFELPKGYDTVTVHAQAGGAGREYWGEALTLTGASTLVLGAITLTTMMQMGALKNNEAGDTASTIEIATITTMALGVVMLAIGVPLRFGGGTSLRLDPPTSKKAGVALTARGIEF